MKQTIDAESAKRATSNNIFYDLHKDLKEDPIWTTRDIYNAKAKKRRERLKPLTPTQILLQ